jgi:hypothetical protein
MVRDFEQDDKPSSTDAAGEAQRLALQAGEECRQAAHRYLDKGMSPTILCPGNHVGVGRQHAKQCKSPGKAPLHLWDGQSLTHDEIDRLFKKYPNANVGIVLGKDSGIIDIEGDGPESDKAMVELFGGDPPPAPTYKSKRGLHRLFRYRDDLPDGAVVHLPAGLEVRTGNGRRAQSAAPPSFHKDGVGYEWLPGCSIDDLDPPELSDDVVARIKASAGEKRGRNGQPEPVEGAIVEQTRHTTLFSLAGSMRHRGMGRDEIHAALVVVNANRCTPPLDDGEVESIASSICRYEPGKEIEKARFATQEEMLEAARKAGGKEASSTTSSQEGRQATAPPSVIPEVPPPTAVVIPEPTPPPPTPPWPDPPAEEAFFGLPGEIVRVIEPETESDVVALLLQLLVAYGSVIGRGAYFEVESVRHHMNLYAVLVGATSKGRKGTSWGRIQALFPEVDEQWVSRRIVSGGLSTGEGVVWHVRDPIVGRDKIKEKGRVVGMQEYELDPGEPDKRLLIIEPEFASVLRHNERQGNNLTVILRQAWETGNLRSLVKNSPYRSTGAHISLVGHVTEEELRRYLTTTEMASGFANRILWTSVRRSKCLPDGGRPLDMSHYVQRLRDAVKFARGAYVGFSMMEAMTADPEAPPTPPAEPVQAAWKMVRDPEAQEIWNAVYGELSAGKPGLTGMIINRMEAQALRLAAIYALMDLSHEIKGKHLLAALALTDYCERSARHIFGDSLGDPAADEILRALRAALPNGLTRTQVSDLFGNPDKYRTGKALALLLQHHLVRMEQQPTTGRPVERWFALKK